MHIACSISNGHPYRLIDGLKALCRIFILAFLLFTNSNAGNYQIPELSPETPIGELVAVNGYNMHLHCLGVGAPTILIDTGLGQHSLEWLPIQAKLAYYSRNCVFDRPGYGWSDWNYVTRHSSNIALELSALLAQKPQTKPYLLIGHSFGGFNMRHFAARHRKEITGLILIETSNENQFELLENFTGQFISPRSNTFKLNFIQTSRKLPNQLKPIIRQLDSLRKFHVALRHEIAESRQNALLTSQLIENYTFPVIVISRGLSPWSNTSTALIREKIWSEMQNDLLRLSTKSLRVIAEKSHHDVHLEQPEVIEEIVRQMLFDGHLMRLMLSK